ncbi:MAG: hypothetical protein AB7K24_13110 [Gemmataceae bacterium]
MLKVPTFDVRPSMPWSRDLQRAQFDDLAWFDQDFEPLSHLCSFGQKLQPIAGAA